MSKIAKIISIALICVAFVACGDKKDGGEGAKPKARKAVESAELQFQEAKSGDTVITLDTSLGAIKAVLYSQYAPQAVENFVGLANQGYYNGLSFHRVVKDFVIQSGDDTATGTGGTTIWDGNPFSVEVSDKLHHYSGALGVARVGDDLNSCKSQFYIVATPQDSVNKDTQKAMTDAGFAQDVVSTYAQAGGAPSLDGQYTVFGQVIEGMDIVDTIANVKLSGSKPTEDILVNSVTVETMP